MGIFSGLRKKMFGAEEKSSLGIRDDVPASEIFGALDSNGTPVTIWTALGQSTVLQCATVLANGVAQVPFRLMRSTDRKKEEASDHPLYHLFKEKPNQWQSSYEFRETIMFQLALTGQAVVWIVRVRGEIKQLIPFTQGNYYVTWEYRNGFPVYIYNLIKPSGEITAVPESDIWHIKWRGYDLRAGLPQMELARSVVGIALSSDKFMRSSLKNGVRTSGMVTSKQSLGEEQWKAIQKTWAERYEGAENAHKTIVLGADLEYKALTQSNNDAQFYENRRFQIEEICRCWNVNPAMVFHTEKTASYSNSEQMFIQHLVHTMSPWYTMLEESAFTNLLTEDERRKQNLYFAFNDAALLRADAKTRAEFYGKMIVNAVYTPNEARMKEDLDPMEGGDKLYIQGAMVPLDMAGEQPPVPVKMNTTAPQPEAGTAADKAEKL